MKGVTTEGVCQRDDWQDGPAMCSRCGSNLCDQDTSAFSFTTAWSACTTRCLEECRMEYGLNLKIGCHRLLKHNGSNALSNERVFSTILQMANHYIMSRFPVNRPSTGRPAQTAAPAGLDVRTTLTEHVRYNRTPTRSFVHDYNFPQKLCLQTIALQDDTGLCMRFRYLVLV